MLKPSKAASTVAIEIYRRMSMIGMTHKALSTRAGLNETYVRDLITAKSKNPRHQHLAAIAHALGCTLNELVDPRPPRPDVAKPELVEKPDELIILDLWRRLTQQGKDRLVRDALAGAPNSAESEDFSTKRNHV